MASGFTFMDIYSFFVFLVILWVVGKISVKINVPSIVGEIVAGLIFGPNLLNLAPFSDVLKMIGECGLILLVIEAGIEVDLDMLKLIGQRGVLVAVFGSMTPLFLGTGIGIGIGATTTSALAIGACLAPTSMGIAVNVLRRGKILNTTVGQLVIAAAVLDDIISLILLSVIQSLADPTIFSVGKPVVVSGAFLVVFGYLAIYVMPVHLPKFIKLFDPKLKDYVSLASVFTFALALIPASHYAGTSYLLGAFLAGLCFCHDHHMHTMWQQQMKRLMSWLLRLFFACTIGFEVPIQDVWTGEIMLNTTLFFTAIVGKLATGIFAPTPWNFNDAMKLGFAMSAWGEFAFIIAKISRDDGLLDASQFSSVVMAVLVSVIAGPIGLTEAIRYDQEKRKGILSDVKNEIDEFTIDPSEAHCVYFEIFTRSKGFWGFYQTVAMQIDRIGLEILDYRANHTYDGRHEAMMEFYVRDRSSYMDYSEKLLNERKEYIIGEVFKVLQDSNANVVVDRWMPRVAAYEFKTRNRTKQLRHLPSMLSLSATSLYRDPSLLQQTYARQSILAQEKHVVQEMDLVQEIEGSSSDCEHEELEYEEDCGIAFPEMKMVSMNPNQTSSKSNHKIIEMSQSHEYKESFDAKFGTEKELLEAHKPALRCCDTFNDRQRTTGDVPIVDIAKKMTSEFISSLLVLDEHSTVLGLVTKTDIVQALSKKSLNDLEKTTASDIMTPAKFLLACDQGEPRQNIFRMMSGRNCKHIVMMDSSKHEVCLLVNIVELIADFANLQQTHHIATTTYI